MKTKSNNNPSKLQSEAVKEFRKKYPKYRYLCRYSDDFKKGEWINIEDVFKFYNDQIQKAYSNGREEVVKEFDKQWADLGVGGKHPPWHVWIENCQLRCLQGTHLDRKKLSIQSKGKIK